MKGLMEDRFYQAVAGSLMLHLCFLPLLGRISFSHQPVSPLSNPIEVIPLRLEPPPPPKPSSAIPSLAPGDIQRNINQSLHEKTPLPHLSQTNAPQKGENHPWPTLRSPSRKTPPKGSEGKLPTPIAPGAVYQGGSPNLPKPPPPVRTFPPSSREQPNLRGAMNRTPTGGPLNLGSPSAQGEDLGPTKGTSLVGIPPNVEGRGTGSGPGEGPGQGEKPASVGGPPPRAEGNPSAGSRASSGEGLSEGKPGPSAGSQGDREGPSSRESPPVHQNRLADRKEPELIHLVPPLYPSEAREEGVEGAVTLEYLINEKGEVKEVRVVKSSGDYRLDRSAVEAVKKWRYLPAIQDGIPRGVRRRRTIEFRLPR